MSEFVPEGWVIQPIQELLDNKVILKVQDGNHGSLYPKTSEFVDNGVPLVAASHINLFGKINFGACPKLTKERASSLRIKPAQGGDVLLTHNATVGRVAVIPDLWDEVVVSTSTTYYRVDSSFLFNNYLYYYFQSPVFSEQLKRIMGQTTRNQVPITAQKELLITLPIYQEQKKIAAILTSVDDVIEKTQAQIDKLKDLKTGMMQELLTRGVGVDGKPHTEFKDSPVGRIPKGWEVEVIGNIFSVQLGKMLSKASKITDSPLPYLGNKNIQWGRVVLDDLERMDFSEKEKKKFSLEAGDLLMCEGGDVGRCAIWMNEMSDCYYQKAIHRLRPVENKYKPVLLMEYMKFAKESGLLVDYISQTSIAHLTKEKLISIPIPVPSIVEQESIVKVLKALSNRLKVAENKLEQNKKLKKALMQDLLTGKKRVKVDS
ncbi:restriction endonuclease subunit S [Vibrio splendidus]